MILTPARYKIKGSKKKKKSFPPLEIMIIVSILKFMELDRFENLIGDI